MGWSSHGQRSIEGQLERNLSELTRPFTDRLIALACQNSSANESRMLRPDRSAAVEERAGGVDPGTSRFDAGAPRFDRGTGKCTITLHRHVTPTQGSASSVDESAGHDRHN